MKILNNFTIKVFGAIGLFALVGAIFFDATHHFVTAAMCAAMVMMSIYDNKKNKKNNV